MPLEDFITRLNKEKYPDNIKKLARTPESFIGSDKRNLDYNNSYQDHKYNFNKRNLDPRNLY